MWDSDTYLIELYFILYCPKSLSLSRHNWEPHLAKAEDVMIPLCGIILHICTDDTLLLLQRSYLDQSENQPGKEIKWDPNLIGMSWQKKKKNAVSSGQDSFLQAVVLDSEDPDPVRQDPQMEQFTETLQVHSLLCFELLAAKSQRQFLHWKAKSYLSSPDQAEYFDILLRDQGFIVIVQNTAELFDAWQIMQGRLQSFRKIR